MYNQALIVFIVTHFMSVKPATDAILEATRRPGREANDAMSGMRQPHKLVALGEFDDLKGQWTRQYVEHDLWGFNSYYILWGGS